jgi:hypothetical protein
MMGKKPSDQVERFRQAARDHGADEDEDKFNDALRTIAKAKPQPQQQPKKHKPATTR